MGFCGRVTFILSSSFKLSNSSANIYFFIWSMFGAADLFNPFGVMARGSMLISWPSLEFAFFAFSERFIEIKHILAVTDANYQWIVFEQMHQINFVLPGLDDTDAFE